MRCDEVRVLLDDYADGALAAGGAARVDDHLAGCPGCAAELEGLRRLLALAADLPREIAPSRDLWPTVAADIAGAPKVVHVRFSGSWRRGLAAAAAAVVVAVGSLLIAYSLGRQHSGVRSALAPAASPLAVPARLGDPSFAVAEAELIDARDQLLAALDARRSSMSPDTLQVVDDSLRLIDGAIARISAALVDDPLNPKLANRLAGAYRTQIELLQRATSLPAEI
jgi:anti-sigma factor RsiW